MESITVGSFTISEVEDGVGHLPPMFYPGADFESQPHLLHEDGTYHIRGGGYVIQGQDAVVLIDAGAGPDDVPFPNEVANAAGLAAPPKNIMNSGLLPASLAELGIKPESVTHIVLTHLHIDHIGWVAPKGERLFFPNAEIYYGDADWTPLIANVPSDDPARLVMEFAREHGVLHPMSESLVEIVPGVRAIHTPGHTPGSYIVAVGSETDHVLLTGDVIEHPDQLSQQGIHFLTDGDREQAAATRSDLISKISASGSPIATAHIPAPVFRRVGKNGDWEPAV